VLICRAFVKVQLVSRRHRVNISCICQGVTGIKKVLRRYVRYFEINKYRKGVVSICCMFVKV